MISYTIIVSFCLLGMVSAQTGMTLESCLTKENNLVILGKTEISSNTKCTYYSEGKVVASSDTRIEQDPTYKNRASAEITGKGCKLTLNGFSSDKSQTFNCTIVGTPSVSQTVTVDKKNALICSACGIFQHVGVTLLLALLASHLIPKLL
ncbi:thy-1 membrane glycoprotein [Colossoma macropomum]|uniref:thy-1 membrane glycoprotein n=1 Tax=Colossoma macropomum TaxID=42526 RepID=UPI001864785E|nr:thy-1 membrane glycoprotein [Colossoma macropomum]